jgi:hypothetical protein
MSTTGCTPAARIKPPTTKSCKGIPFQICLWESMVLEILKLVPDLLARLKIPELGRQK